MLANRVRMGAINKVESGGECIILNTKYTDERDIFKSDTNSKLTVRYLRQFGNLATVTNLKRNEIGDSYWSISLGEYDKDSRFTSYLGQIIMSGNFSASFLPYGDLFPSRYLDDIEQLMGSSDIPLHFQIGYFRKMSSFAITNLKTISILNIDTNEELVRWNVQP